MAGFRPSRINRKPVRTFISYSRDSSSHERWVLMLASDLCKRGIDVTLDVWDAPPGSDLAYFMEEGVRNADRVLLICTSAYVDKANLRQGCAGYEAMIVSGELIRDVGSTKFIPIIRQPPGEPRLPSALAGRVYIDFSSDAQYSRSLNRLVQELHGAGRCSPDRRPSAGKSAATRSSAAECDARAELGTFLEEAFEVIARRFGDWLADLEVDDARLVARFKRLDTFQFSAGIFSHGRPIRQCRIRLRGTRYGRHRGITYSDGDSEFSRRFNEQLSAQSDGALVSLTQLRSKSYLGCGKALTVEEGAELFWQIFVGPLRW